MQHKIIVTLTLFVALLLSFNSATADEMIIGWYVNNDFPDVIDEIMANGANAVHVTESHWGEGLPRARAFLNYAQDKGCKVYLELPFGEVGIGDIPIVEQQVRRFQNYPALLMWRLHEEPMASYDPPKDPCNLIASYQAVKALDTTHPVSCTFASPNLGSYINAVDVPELDVYPCTTSAGTPSSQLYLVPQRLHSVAQQAAAAGKDAPFYLAQSFEEIGGNPPFDFRLPTFDETHYMTFAAFTVGAQGIFYWRFDPAGGYINVTAQHRQNVVYPVIAQLNDVSAAIISPLGAGAVTPSSTHDIDTTGHGINDITYIVRHYTGYGYDDYFLIAANNTPATQSNVTFTLTGLNYDPALNVQALHETSPTFTYASAASTAAITDTFTPWQIHIYRLRGNAIPGAAGTCGDQNHPYPQGDFNQDCIVNLADLALAVENWNLCSNPQGCD